MSGYRAISARYGAEREAEIALIYVTEPMDRATRIKDDASRDPVSVMKLNFSEKFMTGIYPYSVLTSVFCPVDKFREERFTPAKLTLSVQEWCGHVMLGLWPSPGGARLKGMSYFASEGDVDTALAAPDGVLYEDALLIQLRELDGPFAGGAAEWSGPLVPRLWSHRQAHAALAVESAKITRKNVSDAIVRFEMSYRDVVKSYDVERGAERRIVAWQSNDGSKARLVKSERLAYWTMNGPGNEAAREKIGLDPGGRILPFDS